MRGTLLLSLLVVVGCKESKSDPAAVAPATAPAPVTAPAAPAAPPSNELVAFASEESMLRLDRAAQKVDFFTLANHYEGQEHGGMCGPTTAVIVLNALRVDEPPEGKPVDKTAIPATYAAKIPPEFDPFFHRYTQRTFFADPRVTAVKPEAIFYGAPNAEGKRDGGMQLRQLHDILRALGADSTIRVVDDALTDDAARTEIVDNLGRDGDYVIVNYDRKVLGQKGGGHISPLAAYDADSDRFLILDVSRYKYPPVWVSAAELFAAMNTTDSDNENRTRGFVVARR